MRIKRRPEERTSEHNWQPNDDEGEFNWLFWQPPAYQFKLDRSDYCAVDRDKMEINRPVKTLATAITSSFEIDCPLYNWWWAPRSGGGTCHGETSFTLRYWISISIIIRWLENNQASADNPPPVMPAKCCCCSCQLSVAELCRKCKSWCRLRLCCCNWP